MKQQFITAMRKARIQHLTTNTEYGRVISNGTHTAFIVDAENKIILRNTKAAIEIDLLFISVEQREAVIDVIFNRN